jgi:hypothetical protein
MANLPVRRQAVRRRPRFEAIHRASSGLRHCPFRWVLSDVPVEGHTLGQPEGMVILGTVVLGTVT